MKVKTYEEHSLTISQIIDEFQKNEVAAERKSIYTDIADMSEKFGVEITKVQMQFRNEMCGVFIDRFGKDISFRKIDDEHSQLTVEVAVSQQFFGWIFSLGKDVRVTGPDEVVEKMRETAKDFASNYR